MKTLVMVAGVVLTAAAVSAEPQKKPPVPPGRDPGGVAVAVIGAGIDYTRPEIAGRLARDGEGEIVGFDLVENDRRPYPDRPSAGCGAIACRDLPAHLALAEGQAARLAPFRVDVADERMLAGAIGMVAKSPARVVLIDGIASERVLAAAAERFPTLLFVAPAERRTSGATAPDALASVIQAAAAAAATDATPSADLAAPAGGRALIELAACQAACTFPAELADRLAAARVAALAARLVAVEPGLDGAGLKARIQKLATAPQSAAPRGGFIAEPQRPFWQE